MRLFVFGLVLLLTACGGDRIQKQRDPEPIPTPTCGDGKIDEGEACDSLDLGGRTCQSEGFDFGTLGCTPTCEIATAGCTRLCGNGKLDPGEACDGDVGPLACADWGYKRCTDACKIESIHCGQTAFLAGPSLIQDSGGAAVLADIAPKGYADLITAVPSFARLQTHAWDKNKGFTEARKISRVDGAVPLLPIAGDLDGDGHMDLAAINTDGTLDRYRYAGATGFTTQALYGGGTAECRLEAWLGVTKLETGGPDALVALGCPGSMAITTWDAAFVFAGGELPGAPQKIALEGIVSGTVADMDGDGLDDVILITRTGIVVVHPAPDFTAQPPVSIAAPGFLVAAGDLDGDGDADLVAANSGGITVYENLGPTGFAERRRFDGLSFNLAVRDLDLDGFADIVWQEKDKVEIRRNLGGFTFSPIPIPVGPGTPVSLALGDLDGDDDVDLAVTVGSGGAEGTVTHVRINQVQ